MVAGRERQDAALALVHPQFRNRVVGAAKLEGAAALQVLALEKQLSTGCSVGGSGAQDRGSMGDAGKARRGGLQVLEVGQWHAQDATRPRSRFARTTIRLMPFYPFGPVQRRPGRIK
jgi:hypothetical protein